VSVVLVNMTIQEATQHFHVSEKTIRRWIKQGKVEAELRDGRYLVSVTGQSGQTVDQTPLIEQLRSEIDHLREQLARRDEQIDHLTQLMAMQSKTTAALTEQLDTSRALIEDMRRRKIPLLRRIFRWT
jgi:DNA-binding transcriptional MerR regulator